MRLSVTSGARLRVDVPASLRCGWFRGDQECTSGSRERPLSRHRAAQTGGESLRRFHVIDAKFRRSPGHFILQSLLAFVLIAAIVLVMGALTRGAVVAALGASAFIVFATPTHNSAAPRSLIGGHLLCMAIGAVCSLPLRLNLLAPTGTVQALVGAASASLAVFGMVATDTEHPPAAGNALAFAVSAIGVEHALSTVGAVVALAAVRRGLRGWLRNLA